MVDRSNPYRASISETLELMSQRPQSLTRSSSSKGTYRRKSLSWRTHRPPSAYRQSRPDLNRPGSIRKVKNQTV